MDEFYKTNSLNYYYISTSEKVKKHNLIFNLPQTSLVESSKGAGVLRSNFLKFYKDNDGMLMEWTADPDTSISGRLKIVKLEHFINGIKEQLTYLTPNDPLFFFHPIDLFTDEASCGVLIHNGKIEDRMYYNYQGEDEMFDLQIGFYGYLLLANMAKGYFYWPKFLLEVITGKSSTESEDFKKNMPEIFPDFSLEAFTEKFNELRIK